MAELCVDNCDCTNVTIMQLFHELKQKFPAVPDRVISECIRKNHDKGKCEWVLEKENRAYLLYSYPPGLGHTKTMAASTEDFPVPAEGAPVAHFERSVPGRQSLDSLCRRRRLLDHHHYRNLPHLFHDKNTDRFKHHFSDEFLNRPKASAGMEGACDERCSVCLSPRLLDRNERSDPFPLSANTCCCDQLNLTTVIDCKRRSGDDDDVRLEFVSGDKVCCRCERTRVSVSSSASAPVTPSGCQLPFPPLSVDVTTPRHRTALSVQPAPPYLAQVESPSQSQRPFTTVSLTLRPPSCDPQPPIDIRSSAGGGLTYSSCSYHPHQGFRSRLQISIGPGGQGNVSAARTKTANLPLSLRAASSMPDVATVDVPTSSFGGLMLNNPLPPPVEPLNPATQAIVNKQLEKKERLQRELENEKERLKVMREKVTSMELDLRNRLEGNTATSRRTKVQELRDEILRLRTECKHMTAEVDLSSENQVPLGETREDFYRDIYREQEEAATLVNSGTEVRSTLNSIIERRLLPETSETMSSSSSLPAGAAGGAATGDGPNWMCYMCTFRNHPLLNKCEQCDGPRIVLGTAMSSETRTQTQNIHIHVTHHNFPSSSPSSSSSSSSRRMAHSWVV